MKLPGSRWCVGMRLDVQTEVPPAVSTYSCQEGQVVCASERRVQTNTVAQAAKQEIYLHIYMCVFVCTRILLEQKSKITNTS